MKYIIVGMGSFGGFLAARLTEVGHEVVGVDSSEIVIVILGRRTVFDEIRPAILAIEGRTRSIIETKLPNYLILNRGECAGGVTEQRGPY